VRNDELATTTAVELAMRIREREVSPVEVMRATVERAERLHPALNAICTPTFESAMAQAHEAERAVLRNEPLGSLHGVPVTIKDLALTRGVRSMGGSAIHATRIPDVDHVHVERLRTAGAISIGKTSVPEFGWTGMSRSPVTGITHNPWKAGFNAGGSSSGAAACAAAGIAPLHQGSDGAGSIRMPAAFCGVFGLKTSFGRVPYHPMPNNGGISVVGPISRSVRDAALMIDAMAGPDARDPSAFGGGPEHFLARVDEGIAGLRVAWSPDLGYLQVDPEVAAVAAAAARTFEELGCRVDEVDPGWGDPIAIEHCLFPAFFAGMLGHLVDEWEDRMDPGLVAIIRHGQTFTAADVCRALGERMLYWDRVRPFFDRYDLLLTPSLSVTAFPAQRLIPEHWAQHPWDWLRWAGFSYPFNLTGQPAATCPCGFDSHGLPVGLQIVGGFRDDLRVLQAARAFEQARPWGGTWPASVR